MQCNTPEPRSQGTWRWAIARRGPVIADVILRFSSVNWLYLKHQTSSKIGVKCDKLDAPCYCQQKISLYADK